MPIDTVRMKNSAFTLHCYYIALWLTAVGNMGLCRKVIANDHILSELNAVSFLTYLLMKVLKQDLSTLTWPPTFQILSVFLFLAILNRKCRGSDIVY
jgi:hypothetical protein